MAKVVVRLGGLGTKFKPWLDIKSKKEVHEVWLPNKTKGAQDQFENCCVYTLAGGIQTEKGYASIFLCPVRVVVAAAAVICLISLLKKGEAANNPQCACTVSNTVHCLCVATIMTH